MSTASLWPEFTAPPRGMRQILFDAAGDIKEKTNGVVRFYVDIFRTEPGLSHSCYLRAEKADYNYLLFRVETLGPSPFPARLIAPDMGVNVLISDEATLRSRLQELFNHPTTKELVLNLMANFG